LRTILSLVQKIISASKHELFWTKNTKKGLDMAINNPSDLILLDLGLPDSDGQTLSVWLQGESTLENVPIVVLTT
jgi:DNA-binding response OmpR family regulator